jgi:hypothetical protein
MNRTFISCFKCYKNKFFYKLNYDKQLNTYSLEIYQLLLNGLKHIITKEFSDKDDSNVSQSIKSTKREKDNCKKINKNEKSNISNINDISSNVQLLSEQTFLKLNDNKSTKNIINNKNLIDIDKENKKENNDDMILSNSQQNLIERFNILSQTFTKKKIINLNENNENNHIKENFVTPINLERSLTKFDKKNK